MKKNYLVKITMVAVLCAFFASIAIFESCHNPATDPDGKPHIIIPENFPAGINFPVDSGIILG